LFPDVIAARVAAKHQQNAPAETIDPAVVAWNNFRDWIDVL